jgi:hypothetical protein
VNLAISLLTRRLQILGRRRAGVSCLVITLEARRPERRVFHSAFDAGKSGREITPPGEDRLGPGVELERGPVQRLAEDSLGVD